MLAEVVLQKIADQLQDAGLNGLSPNVQWPKDELIRYVNEGRRLITELRPSAGSTSEAVFLDGGAEQKIPTKGARFLRAHHLLRYSDRSVLPLGPANFRQDTVEDLHVVQLTDQVAMVLYRDLGASGFGMACLAVRQEDWVRYTTPVPFNTGYTTMQAIALSANRVLVVYDDLDNGSFGTSCILQVDREDIWPGPSQVFASVATAYPTACLLDNGAVLAAYQDQVNGSKATAVVLKISDYRVQKGMAVVCSTGSAAYLDLSRLTQTKGILCFRDQANSNKGTAIVLAVSGYVITVDLTKAAVFQASAVTNLVAFRLSGGNLLVAYTDGGNSSEGTACVLSVSGITITPGTAVVFRASSTLAISGCALPGNLAALSYADAGATNKGKSQVLSVAGTTITTHSEVIWNAGASLYTGICALGAGYLLAVYQDGGTSNQGLGTLLGQTTTTLGLIQPLSWTASNCINMAMVRLDSQHLLAVYGDSGNSNFVTAVVFLVVGDVITAGTPVQVAAADVSGSGRYLALVALEPGSAIVVYRDASDSNKGKAVALAIAGTVVTAGAVATVLATEARDLSVSRLTTNVGIVAFRDHVATTAKVAVLQLAGSTITPGTPVLYSTGDASGCRVHGFSATQAVATYLDASNQNRLTGISMSVATNVITVNPTATAISTAEATGPILHGVDASIAEVIWSDQGNQGRLSACLLYAPGLTVQAGPVLQVTQNPAQYQRLAVVDDLRSVIAYQDITLTGQISGVVLKRNKTTMELTAGPTQVLNANFGSSDAPIAALTSTRLGVAIRGTSGPLCMLALPGNVGAQELTLADLDTMDRHRPGWRGDPPDAASQSFLYDPLFPRAYFIWPPVPANSSLPLYLEYSRNPDDLPQSTSTPPYSATTTELDFEERYEQLLVDWGLYRAFHKDDDVDLMGKAQALLAKFERVMGIEEKKDADVAPQSRSFANQAMVPKPTSVST